MLMNLGLVCEIAVIEVLEKFHYIDSTNLGFQLFGIFSPIRSHYPGRSGSSVSAFISN